MGNPRGNGRICYWIFLQKQLSVHCQYKQRPPWFDRPGRQELRRSFLLVLCVLKVFSILFLTIWSWKTLGFAGQKLPNGFCVCNTSVREALACVEVSEHETRAPLAVGLLVPKSCRGKVFSARTATQMDVTNFARFPPKKEEKVWTEWGVTLCPSEGCSKGYFLAEVANTC